MNETDVRIMNRGGSPTGDIPASQVKFTDTEDAQTKVTELEQEIDSSVRFDEAQTLTDAQKEQARVNIDANLWKRGEGVGSIITTSTLRGKATGEKATSIADGKATGDYSIALGSSLSESTFTKTDENTYTTPSFAGLADARNWYRCAEAWGCIFGLPGHEPIPISSISLDESTKVITFTCNSDLTEYNTITPYYGYAKGRWSIACPNAAALGNQSFAANAAVTAGLDSFAEGTGYASGKCAHAEGGGAQATGSSSHSEGYQTIASALATHAEGYASKASGQGSHAEGAYSEAIGQASHTEGQYCTANNKSEHAQGQFNVSDKKSTTFGDAGNTIHSVGIGTAETDRKNAEEIMQNGDFYLLGIGGYDGTNANAAGTKTVQTKLNDKVDKDNIATTITPQSVNTDVAGAAAVYNAATTPIVESSDTAVTVAMDCGKKYKYMDANGIASLAFTLNAPTDATKANIWYLKFRSGATATNVSFPSGLWYPNGQQPSIEANTIYEIMIDEDYCLTMQAYKQIIA